MNERIAEFYLVFVFIFAYLRNFKDINMKDISFSRKINKNIYADTDYWELYASPLGKNILVRLVILSLEMQPFTSSNYNEKKKSLP